MLNVEEKKAFEVIFEKAKQQDAAIDDNMFKIISKGEQANSLSDFDEFSAEEISESLVDTHRYARETATAIRNIFPRVAGLQPVRHAIDFI